MFKKVLSISLLICMVLTAPTYGSVEAKDTVIDESTKAQLIQKLSENRVPKDKQKTLIEKLENGEEWDCSKESELEKVPTDFNIIDLESSPYAKKYYRFSDGSYIMIECGEKGKGKVIETAPDSDVIAYGLSGTESAVGTDSGAIVNGSSGTNYGTTYWDWKIEKSTAFVSARFYFDGYRARVGCGVSKIDAVKWGVTDGFGATAPTTEVARAEEILSTSQAALGRMFWQSEISFSGGWGNYSGTVSSGKTCELWLALVNGQMYVDSKLPY